MALRVNCFIYRHAAHTFTQDWHAVIQAKFYYYTWVSGYLLYFLTLSLSLSNYSADSSTESIEDHTLKSLSESQLQQLQKAYHSGQHTDSAYVQELSSQIKLPESKIKVCSNRTPNCLVCVNIDSDKSECVCNSKLPCCVNRAYQVSVGTDHVLEVTLRECATNIIW